MSSKATIPLPSHSIWSQCLGRYQLAAEMLAPRTRMPLDVVSRTLFGLCAADALGLLIARVVLGCV